MASSIIIFFLVNPQQTDYAYMNLLRIISIVVSTVTIPAVYFLAKKFVDSKFALLIAAFFAFDPNLIENSIFGIIETLFLLLCVISLNFIFTQNHKFLYISAIFAGLAIDVRLNWIILFIILIIVVCTRPNIDRRGIKIGLVIVILAISASPLFLQNIEKSGNPFESFIGTISNAEESPLLQLAQN